MRVLLINPPAPVEHREFPLALGYLTTVLEREGHEVRNIDARALYRPRTIGEIVKEARDFEPSLIGITMDITFIHLAYQLAQALRPLGIPLVGGGPHPNCVPEEPLRHGFDVVCRGEGEITVLELARWAGGELSLKDIMGISYLGEDGRVIHNPPRPWIEDIDSLPFPAWHHFHIRDYSGSDDPESEPYYWRIFSSRGCPFNCIYCASHGVFGRLYRFRTPRSMFEEMRFLRERYGAPIVNFVDDELTINKRRVYELCDLLMAHRELGIRWNGRARINSVTPDLLKRMEEAGLFHVQYGVESGDPETLRRIKKRVSLEQIRRGIQATIEAGMPSFGVNNLIGFPWEDERHIENTLALNSSIPENVHCSHTYNVPIPYPRTELYESYHEEYGFTDWWLRPESHERTADPTGYTPYYQHYMPFLNHFVLRQNFFKYRRHIKRKIKEVFLISGRLGNRRLYGKRQERLINILCRVSALLYRMSPRLEKALFSLLKNDSLQSSLKRLVGWKPTGTYHVALRKEM